MPTSFRLKTKAEIQAQMFATHRAMQGNDIDLNIGSLDRTQIEASALQDAEQYVQIGKILDLFSRRNCKGDDLDRRAEDFGSLVFEQMRRRKASQSTTQIIVGDGSIGKTAFLATDLNSGALTFVVTDATGWPVSGELVIERGTLREETIVYTLLGNTFTVVFPSFGGLVNPHLQGGKVETTSTKSILNAGIIVGALACQLKPGTETAWPSSGSIIFERSTVRRETIAFTRVGTNLTLGAPTAFAHAISTDVILSTFGSDRPIVSGSVCLVPASAASTSILFRSDEAGLVLDGDLTSNLILVKSDAVGVQTRVGSNTITQWQGEPFANATVTNPNAATGGIDQEDDDTYNDRISAFIQSLSRGTPLSIETLVAGQRDPFSDRLIAFAQTVEPVAPGESSLYVTDGTPSFSVDLEVKTGRDVLISDARIGDKRARLHAFGPFAKVANPAAQRTPRLFTSQPNGSGVATLVGVNFLEDSAKIWTVNQWVGFVVKTDDNQFYPIASNSAIRLILTAGGLTPSLGSYAIFNLNSDPLIPDIDYKFNMSNGDLELTTALGLHDALIAADDNALGSVGAYTFTRGLVAFAQRLVNGDKSDVDNFPGIRSLGTQCRVVIPTIVTPTITIQVLTVSGISDADLASTVQSIIQSYINGLGIGQSVIIAEIIRLVKSLPSVIDCKVLSPTANFAVQDGQMAKVNASDIVVV